MKYLAIALTFLLVVPSVRAQAPLACENLPKHKSILSFWYVECKFFAHDRTDVLNRIVLFDKI